MSENEKLKKSRDEVKRALIRAGRTEREAEIEIVEAELHWAFTAGPGEMFR